MTLHEGGDATVIARGRGVKAAQEAADTLEGQGLSVRVLDAVYLQPLDGAAIPRRCARDGGDAEGDAAKSRGGFWCGVADVLACSGSATCFAKLALPSDYALVAPLTHLDRHYSSPAAASPMDPPRCWKADEADMLVNNAGIGSCDHALFAHNGYDHFTFEDGGTNLYGRLSQLRYSEQHGASQASASVVLEACSRLIFSSAARRELSLAYRLLLPAKPHPFSGLRPD